MNHAPRSRHGATIKASSVAEGEDHAGSSDARGGHVVEQNTADTGHIHSADGAFVDETEFVFP